MQVSNSPKSPAPLVVVKAVKLSARNMSEALLRVKPSSKLGIGSMLPLVTVALATVSWMWGKCPPGKAA